MYRVGAVADLIRQQSSKPDGKSKCNDVTEGPSKPLYSDYTPSETSARKRKKRKREIDRIDHSENKTPKMKRKGKADNGGDSSEEAVEQMKRSRNRDADVPVVVSDADLQEEFEREVEVSPRRTIKRVKDSHEESEELASHKRPAKQTKASQDDEAPQKELAEETPERRARTIFVGNLPAATSKKELKRLFSKYGAIEGLRFRSIAPARENYTKKVAAINRKLINENKNTVNAYVVFKDRTSANDALVANATIVAGNHICVDKADGKRQVDSSRSVFVGNLPLHTTDEELWKCFSECGKIHSVRIVRDSNTGMGKGFGFVCFKGLDAVALALEMNGMEISGRFMRVMPVQKRLAAKKLRRMEKKGKQKKTSLQEAEPSTDFRGARAERLQRKKKLKKLIKAKKKETKAKMFFGYKVGKKSTKNVGDA